MITIGKIFDKSDSERETFSAQNSQKHGNSNGETRVNKAFLIGRNASPLLFYVSSPFTLNLSQIHKPYLFTKKHTEQLFLWSCPSEVSPVWPGLHCVECQAANNPVPQRVPLGRLQLWSLPARWRRTGRQVPGGGANSARLRPVLWERSALPGGK